jgi:GNAT superfamily N-acetyltransferase
VSLEPSLTISSASMCELTTVAEIRAAQRLRYTVWQSEGAEIHSSEQRMIADYHDEHATHWGFFDGGMLVGAARLCLHDKLNEAPDGEMFSRICLPAPVASMNRMIVLKSHRGLGIGTQLDEVRIARAWKLRAGTIIATPVNASSRRLSFDKRGFTFLTGVSMGNPIYAPTIQICACYLILGSPTLGEVDE